MLRLLLLFTLLLSACATTSTIPDHCEVMVDGQCFMEAKEACRAAGCPDNCLILESYPGQVQCMEPGPEPVTAPEVVQNPRPVLFVLSGHTQLGDTGKSTGYFLSEVAHPWHVITEAGFTVEFVSPNGGRVEMDPKSNDLEDPINKAFLDNPANVESLTNTMSPDDIVPGRYAAIYYAGGHGAMWDFPENAALARAAAAIWENGGVVAAVCHGPAGLVNIKLSDGTYLISGKKLAAFTNAEEDAVKLTKTVPFLLATRLEERGATHVPAADFQEQVVVDGRLVTGQNPASATAAGHAIVKLLKP